MEHPINVILMFRRLGRIKVELRALCRHEPLVLRLFKEDDSDYVFQQDKAPCDAVKKIRGSPLTMIFYSRGLPSLRTCSQYHYQM